MDSSKFKSYLVIGLIVIGFLLVLASIVIPSGTFNFTKSKKIGFIAEISGAVTLQGLDQIESSSVKKDSQLLNFDSLKVGANSDVLVVLDGTGAELRITSNSEAMFEYQDDKSILVSIKAGEILIEKFGEEPLFWVNREGRQLSAKDYAFSDEKTSEKLREKGVVLSDADHLSQAKIEEILNSKRNDFFRCYGQLIQKKEQAVGQVVISFEIVNSGRVAKSEISKSEISDNTFSACITEVIERIQFPRFKGQPINTVFPLKFE